MIVARSTIANRAADPPADQSMPGSLDFGDTGGQLAIEAAWYLPAAALIREYPRSR